MSNKDEFEELAGNIILKRITRRNLGAVLKLKVKPNQELLVATNAKSIAQAFTILLEYSSVNEV